MSVENVGRGQYTYYVQVCVIAAKKILLNGRNTIYVTWDIVCGANSVHPREIHAAASDARSERGFSRTK